MPYPASDGSVGAIPGHRRAVRKTVGPPAAGIKSHNTSGFLRKVGISVVVAASRPGNYCGLDREHIDIGWARACAERITAVEQEKTASILHNCRPCDRDVTLCGAIGAIRLYLWHPFRPFRYIQVVVLE